MATLDSYFTKKSKKDSDRALADITLEGYQTEDISLNNIEPKRLKLDRDVVKQTSENQEHFKDAEVSLEKQLMPNEWFELLKEEMPKPYFKKIKQFLKSEKTAKKCIFPLEIDMYSFMACPLDDIKVVILGQDPYHGDGQAHGLCFSVKKGITTPPSLKNIYKELQSEYTSFKVPSHGSLLSWCKQGVLLLNASLTVERGKPNSHAKCGWQMFTDKIIQLVSLKNEGIVFMLWGAFAQKKSILVDKAKHLILSSAHPSPLSAHNGFLGNGHFKKANEYLESKNRTPIDWDSLNTADI